MTCVAWRIGNEDIGEGVEIGGLSVIPVSRRIAEIMKWRVAVLIAQSRNNAAK
jgi:hypothetical protein